MKYLLLAALAMGPGGEPTVWVFFSPDTPDASRLFSELKELRVRPVLLVERFEGTREPSEAFLANLRAAGEIRVVDEEGLREAERLKLRRLPAVAVTRGGRSHVVYGTRADLGEILKCSK